jgi:hypothetical protein
VIEHSRKSDKRGIAEQDQVSLVESKNDKLLKNLSDTFRKSDWNGQLTIELPFLALQLIKVKYSTTIS